MALGSRSADCCCCFGVRTGTLMLLCLELFCYAGLSLVIFDSIQSGRLITIHSSYMDSIFSGFGSHMIIFGMRLIMKFIEVEMNYRLRQLFIGCLIMLVIILAGLISIWKKKPSLLIPYFIIRILYAVIVIAIIPEFLIAQKEILDKVDAPKAVNNMVEDFTGFENSFGKNLRIISGALYILMAMEILLMVLMIHFAKVVYACYKQI